MKNREVWVFIASMMLVGLVAGSLAGAPVNIPEKGNVSVTSVEYAAAENKETVKTDSETKSSEKSSDKKSSKTSEEEFSSAKPKKEETVYAKIDGSGSVKSVTVSDQLKNISAQSKLEDISDLQDIVNVKGDEAFSTMGSNVVWDTADADICYQGTTTKELPVGIKISYKLDGKDISAADLKGKSGHVTIRYTYENKSGSQGKASTPFMMATGLILDEETFKNVTVENGKLISDGERNMVIGYGLPAMKNILGIEDKDVDIPDYFEVGADVTEYEPVQGLTIATNNIFNDMNTDDFDSLDDLQDSMDELQDASNQLVSGSGELKNGIDTLLASSGTLTEGIDQLVAGGGDLQAGTSELADGSVELADGSKELADGNAKLADGSKELADGNSKLADGTRQLYDGTKTLASGAGELSAGLKSAASQTSGVLLSGAEELKKGIGKLERGMGSLSKLGDGIAQLNAGMNGKPGLKEGAAEVAGGIDQLAKGLGASQSQAISIQTVADQLVNLQNIADSIPTEDTADVNQQVLQSAENITANTAVLEAQLNELESNNIPVVISETAEVNPAVSANLSSLISVLSGISTTDENVNSAVQAAIGYAESAQNNLYTVGENVIQSQGNAATTGYAQAARTTARAIAADTNTIMAEVSAPYSMSGDTENQIRELRAGIDALAGTVQDMQIAPQADNTQLVESIKKLQAGAKSLQAGIDEAAAGVAYLNQQVNESGMIDQVTGGVNQLKDGSDALVKGIRGDLVNGLNQLSAGAQKLDAGSAELSEKMGEVNEGAQSAASGAAELASGASDAASGASELASGAFDLANGTFRLNDGALTLKDGLNTLQSGSGELINGVQRLDDGAAELNDGMIQFDRDGIQKLVDVFGGDVEGLLDKMNEMLDVSRAYKNFSGISADMDGEVKFVFVTEE